MPCGVRPRTRREGPQHPRWWKARRGVRTVASRWHTASGLGGTRVSERGHLATSSESGAATPERHRQSPGEFCVAGSVLDPSDGSPSPEHTRALAAESPAQPQGGPLQRPPQPQPQRPEQPTPQEQLLGGAGAGPELTAALAAIYVSLTAAAPRPQQVTCFHSTREPSMGVDAYLERLRTYCRCSDACLVVSLVYVDRVVKLHPEFQVCRLNIHRLLAATIVLAAKFLDDVYYSNSYYAKVCGLSLKELNTLELALVKMLNWRCDISPEEFDEYCRHVLLAARGEVAAA